MGARVMLGRTGNVGDDPSARRRLRNGLDPILRQRQSLSILPSQTATIFFLPRPDRKVKIMLVGAIKKSPVTSIVKVVR